MEYDNNKWEVRPCHMGEGCWCRTIFTVTDKEILGEGCIHKELVEYLVFLHNRHLIAHAVDC